MFKARLLTLFALPILALCSGIAIAKYYHAVRNSARMPLIPWSSEVMLGNSEGWCSGAVVAKGLIVTAGHCIKITDRESDQTVFYMDGSYSHYRVLASEYSPGCMNDWALIMADTGNRLPIPLAKLGPKIGDTVYHIGHPKHQIPETLVWGTVTDIIPSNIEIAGSAIPGESGSALLNSQGQLIGIVVCGSDEETLATTPAALRMLLSLVSPQVMR